MPRPDPEDPEEPALLSRLQNGEPGAAAAFVERHRSSVYRVAYRLCGNHADADDLVQETFLRALQAINGFRGDSALGTWLHRIAINLTVNRVRSAAVVRRDSRPAEDVLPASPAEAEGALLTREREARVRAAVAQLPPKQREVLVLHVYEEWPFLKIAEAMDCAVGTAKANFFHAVSNLKKRLSGDERPGEVVGRER